MTDPLDILRAPAPRARLDASGNAAAEFSDKYAREGGGNAGDIAEAVATFNAMHTVHELLASSGVELLELGREWHTVNGCPLPGCTSTHDAFRVHIDRKAGDTRGPQWACRKCERGGDALRLAMLLAGADPVERGATARFLRERGHLADRSGHARTDSNREAVEPNNGLEMGSKHPTRTQDFAQERLGSPGAGSGHVKAGQRSFERKETRDSDTNQRDHRPSLQGQVPRVPPPVRREGQAVSAVSRQGPTPVGGRGELRPVPAPARAGRGELVPADPLRWSRPDVLAAFGRHPTPDEIEALDERAGILEFEAGLTRQDAEAEALHLCAEGDNL